MMKHVVLNIPDRDYRIIEKYAFVCDLTVEELAWRSLKNSCSSELDWQIGKLMGFDDETDYFEIWSPDVDRIMKGERA
jgi:hypothetical protein